MLYLTKTTDEALYEISRASLFSARRSLAGCASTRFFIAELIHENTAAIQV